MKLELETNPTAFPYINNEFTGESAAENGSALVKPMLQRGIKAAQEGNRGEAKQMLLRVVEIESTNETAWMWLASISEYPEELLACLNNVLSVNPKNERALEWTKSTKSLLANNFVQLGINASKEGQKEFARQSFMQAISHHQENEAAWLWLASVSESVEEKTSHLRKVLNINPENENALLMLKALKNQKIDTFFKQAISEAVSNKRAEASETLSKVLEESPGMEDAWALKSFLAESLTEKIGCYERILEVNPDSPLANVNWTALLELMSRVESVEQIEENKKLAAAAANETQTKEVQRTNFSANVPVAEPEAQKTFVEKTVALPEIPAPQSNVMPDFSGQESNFKSPETTFEVSAPAPNAEPETFEVDEPVAESPSRINFYSGEEYEESVLMQNHPAAEQKTVDETEPENTYSNNFEEQENSADSQNNVYHESLSEEAEVWKPENNQVLYYETEEDIFAPTPVPETDYSLTFGEAERDYTEERNVTAAETAAVEDESTVTPVVEEVRENQQENVHRQPPEMAACPFCETENEAQEFVCNWCHSMLTLSDLEMLLAHQEADKDVLREAVSRMETESEQRSFDAHELKMLGIGHINLKHLRLGYSYLQDAVKLNPNNVILSSQVNALAIRLSEIEQQESIHSSTPKNRRILVVDDSATVRKLISGKLEKSGHEVLCAIDGIEALEKINENVPDLILLDINMPRMDGYQVCKLIRNNEATKDVPVVMISGKDGFFDKVRGRMAGTTGYITKPFGPETLMKTVETYII